MVRIMSWWILGTIAVMVLVGIEFRRWLWIRALVRLRTRQDGLTQLPNRVALEESLTRTIASEAEGSSFALIVIGLDRFHCVNSTYGFSGGDRFLVRLAQRLRHVAGNKGMAVRLGGDEFALTLLGNKDRESAARLATAALRAVEDCSNDGFCQAGVSASIGVSLFPGAVSTADEALRRADAAMRDAKRLGGGTVSFGGSGGPLETAVVYRESERAVRDLIRGALDQGGFRVVFQPVLDRYDRVVQMEALVRIHDRDLGVVPPDEFLGVAEQTGLIHEMGRWVFGEACRYASAWRGAGKPVAVAVNVSASQLNEPSLIGFVLQTMANCGLPGSAIVLEITEAGGGEISDEARASLHVAREAGLGISVDGFAGDIPEASIEKVDFANLTAEYAAGRAIAVKCVEEFWQLERAREMSCTLFQGYLIAPPLEPDDATQFLLTRTTQQERTHAG